MFINLHLLADDIEEGGINRVKSIIKDSQVRMEKIESRSQAAPNDSSANTP